MGNVNITELNIGDIVTVRCGKDGVRYAIYHGRKRSGKHKVEKYLATSDRFTNIMTVDTQDILERLHDNRALTRFFGTEGAS